VTADPQASGEQPRRGPKGRRAAALIALALGAAGFLFSATGMATQLLPRKFTAPQQQQIVNWEISSRWQQLSAGKIFPASVPYVLNAAVLQDATSLNLHALRVGIAPQSGCGAGVITTSAAATVLRHDGCQAVLRATYVDASLSYVMTVGVAVLPSDASAAKAYRSLSQTKLTAADDAATTRLPAGIAVVRYRGTAGAMYDYSRQISAILPAADSPYLVMYAVGYADRRPHVPVASDHYSYEEMSSLASGVADSVQATLTRPPASPHCPGTPGC
jgi:hypothetical protein